MGIISANKDTKDPYVPLPAIAQDACPIAIDQKTRYYYVATHIRQAIDTAAMKTTIDISDALLREARKVAARHGMTLRALVEQGLRKVLAEKARRIPFRLRKASFKGRGLRPELRDATWEDMRDLIYKGRGS